MKSSILLLSILGITMIPPWASAQNLDLPYSSGSTGSDGALEIPILPHPAIHGSMVYDAARQECVYFGGGTINNSGVYSDTWTWNGVKWTLKGPPVRPPARRNAGMVYDPIRQEVVLFGGYNTVGLPSHGDTWVWNGTTWAQKSPATAPSGRGGPAMTWDEERGEAVLWGGALSGGSTNDTWVWNGTNWTQKSPATSPGSSSLRAMGFDPVSRKVVLARTSSSGTTTTRETWSWDGTNWTLRGAGLFDSGAMMAFSLADGGLVLMGGNTSSAYLWNDAASSWTLLTATRFPTARASGVLAYDSARDALVVSHGSFTSGSAVLIADTFERRGGDWYGAAGIVDYEMGGNVDGIWNYTSINVPQGTNVRFLKGNANHGVLWLASESVTIDGVLNVSGSPGTAQGTLNSARAGGLGGPGGYDGGTCGPAIAGNGPGGGPPGARPASNGLHADASGAGPYGTLFAQPALGGSGGGGHNGAGSTAGGSGGGGGGALVIASSSDISVNGSILAKGGAGGGTNATGGYGGDGSGGLVRLVGDRVILGAAAVIDAGDTTTTGKGRVRIEGYVRQIPNAATQVKGSSSASVPVQGSVLNQAGGRLRFAKVDGVNVANPPKGDEINPDVIFTATGAVDIEVHAINIPDGTPVTVTINHSLAGVITLPAVTLLQCKAVFTATIPAGSGLMQAFATYNVGGPTGGGQP